MDLLQSFDTASMKIAIVGHGPSLQSAGLGPIIDSHDIVIRQKAIAHNLVCTYPKDFGKKTSIICGSYTIRESLFWDVNAKIWVFVDSRHSDINIPADNRFIILKDVCNYWNNIYRSLRTNNYIRHKKMTIHKTSSDVGHNHMSCGLHTIIYACEILKPKKLTLFGFDNIKSGAFTWSLTRGESWDQYPDHRWDVEQTLVKNISDKYNVELDFV